MTVLKILNGCLSKHTMGYYVYSSIFCLRQAKDRKELFKRKVCVVESVQALLDESVKNRAITEGNPCCYEKTKIEPALMDWF